MKWVLFGWDIQSSNTPFNINANKLLLLPSQPVRLSERARTTELCCTRNVARYLRHIQFYALCHNSISRVCSLIGLYCWEVIEMFIAFMFTVKQIELRNRCECKKGIQWILSNELTPTTVCVRVCLQCQLAHTYCGHQCRLNVYAMRRTVRHEWRQA